MGQAEAKKNLENYTAAQVWQSLADEKKQLNAYEITSAVGEVSLTDVEAWMQHNHVSAFTEENLASILDLTAEEAGDEEELQEAVRACLRDVVARFETVNAEIKALLKTEGYRCYGAHEAIVGADGNLTPSALSEFCADHGTAVDEKLGLRDDAVDAIFTKLGKDRSIEKDTLTKFLRGCYGAPMVNSPPML